MKRLLALMFILLAITTSEVYTKNQTENKRKAIVHASVGTVSIFGALFSGIFAYEVMAKPRKQEDDFNKIFLNIIALGACSSISFKHLKKAWKLWSHTQKKKFFKPFG